MTFDDAQHRAVAVFEGTDSLENSETSEAIIRSHVPLGLAFEGNQTVGYSLRSTRSRPSTTAT